MNTISSFVRKRQISEVLHFTTHLGLMGIFECEGLLPYNQLKDEKKLEFILQINTKERVDRNWLGYVNLSISQINNYFFSYSQGEHPDVLWYVISFSPEILEHTDVVFTTTNNIYKQVQRGTGLQSLAALFADPVVHDKGTIHRWSHSPWMTTCRQAEVLYPKFLSLDYALKIYAQTEEGVNRASSILDVTQKNKHRLDIIAQPGVFR